MRDSLSMHSQANTPEGPLRGMDDGDCTIRAESNLDAKVFYETVGRQISLQGSKISQRLRERPSCDGGVTKTQKIVLTGAGKPPQP